MEKEEQIVQDMQGNSIEEKTSNIINWFMHNEVKEKPKSNPSSSSKAKRKRGNQKTFSIESTQEDESNLPSVGCRIRMCVGYDDKGKMSAVIITPKEDVDYQFWYPKRNRVINEYKYRKESKKTIIPGLMKWKKKANMLKAQHRPRSMILELHKRNREQKRRIQASFPIKRIQETLQV